MNRANSVKELHPYCKTISQVLNPLLKCWIHCRYRKLDTAKQNKKPLKLDNYRGITTSKSDIISFYGSFNACKLSCVFFIDEECSGSDSSFDFTTVSFTTTAERKAAARIPERAANPINALAGGTAANEKSIMAATINAILF